MKVFKMEARDVQPGQGKQTDGLKKRNKNETMRKSVFRGNGR